MTQLSATVFVGQLPHDVRIEEPARSGTPSENQLLDHRPEAAAQPTPDRHGKPHLAAREDRGGHQIPHRGPKHRLGRPSPQFEPAWHRGNVLDETVVEKWHSAFNRGGHAHLVLLHQQFLQIGLQIDAAHALEHGSRAFLVAARLDGVGVPRAFGDLGRKKPAAKDLWKHREVLQKQTPIARLECDKATTRVTRDGLGERLDEIPHVPPQAPRRDRPVGPAETGVPQRHAVAVIAEEQFIGAFACENDLDVLACQA